MLRTTISRTALTAVGCLILLSGVATADTKIKSRQTTGGQTYENTSYIKGKRQRSETMNGQMIMVQQCDLRRNIQIMPQTRTYLLQPYDDASTTPTNASGARYQPGVTTRGGVITSTITTRDTGERKQMFGYTARHIITSMVMESSPDACSPLQSKMEIDGWYIDAAFVVDCENQRYVAGYRPQPKGGCQDRYETKQIGLAKRGYPVWEKTTQFGENGGESFSMINEVVELSQATLDPALFEVPAGYSEVKDLASAYSTMGNSSSTGTVETSATTAAVSNANSSANVKNKSGQTAGDVTTEPGAKKEGVTRLGLVTVKTGSVGEGLSARDLAAAVQNTFTEYLKAPNLELVAIEAELPASIEAEAKQKQCDFVIYASVSHKKGGGGGFGSAFGATAPMLGSAIGTTGSYGGYVAGQVATTAIVAATMSENVKAKDELTLDIRLQSTGSNAAALVRQFKAKAKSAGEDIITPVIEQAAQAIVDVVAKS